MNAAPRVSVLLPARDAGPTLAASLRSVQRQTEARFECVVVDDGSNDGSADLVRAFAARDARFRLVSRPRAGLVAALEAGLAECRGAVVARMDADDVMARDRLALQLDLLDARPDLDAVGGHVRIFPRAGLSEGLREYERWLNGIRTTGDVRREAFVECPVAHPTLAIRTGTLRSLGYRTMGWPEDYDLVLRLLESHGSIGMVPRRLLAWRDHPGRLTRSGPEYRIDRFPRCKAAFLVRGFLAASERYILWGYGHTGRAIRRALLEHGREPSHVVELHPGRLGNSIHGAPVVPPEAIPDLPRSPLLASVAGAVARSRIRAALREMGYLELEDFVCVA